MASLGVHFEFDLTDASGRTSAVNDAVVAISGL
jgi:hypothetical protein